MPNLLFLGLCSYTAKLQQSKLGWNANDKWISIYTDLITLYDALQRLKDPKTHEDALFDVNFVYMINEYKVRGSNKKRVKRIKRNCDKYYEKVNRFIDTYQYLSYIMLKTQVMMAYYFLMCGRIDMIKDTMKLMSDNVEFAVHLPRVLNIVQDITRDYISRYDIRPTINKYMLDVIPNNILIPIIQCQMI
jgi:hypothetical protein